MRLRDLEIPLPRDVKRRLELEQDAVEWLRYYFHRTFFQDFTDDRQAMLQSIVDAASYGGDQALSASRGDGKTRIAVYGALYLIIKHLARFPVVIGKSHHKALGELKTIRERILTTERFVLDYPEISFPFKAAGSWSSKTVQTQTVGGRDTGIEVSGDHFIFPTITQDMLGLGWPEDVRSAASGQCFACCGIDGPIRGMNYYDERPDIAILDDIEDRQAAFSDAVIERNEELLNQDIAGLGGSTRRVSRVMLCTPPNRKCIAFRYTDPILMPSWRGKRFRRLVEPPEHMDLWQKYIELRRTRAPSDPDARAAFRFYRDQRELMDEGAVLSNPYAFDTRQHVDGEPMELSSLQAYYNLVADIGQAAVSAELDSNPPLEAGPSGLGLTAGLVLERQNDLDRRQLPASTSALVAALDIGKYRCHWVVVAWSKGATGYVVDYGVHEIYGQQAGITDRALDMRLSEPQIYRGLCEWRDWLLGTDWVDASGAARSIDAVFVDSGTYTNAAYEFVRQVRKPFYASKGIGNYRPKTRAAKDLVPLDHMHMKALQSENCWLVELDTSYWKQFCHERLATPTWDLNNQVSPGSLSLFRTANPQAHSSYAQQITAEELVTEFKEGKGAKTYWVVNSPSNHWLDATYMACAAGRMCGVNLLEGVPKPESHPSAPRRARRRQLPHQQGNWMQRVRRNK